MKQYIIYVCVLYGIGIKPGRDYHKIWHREGDGRLMILETLILRGLQLYLYNFNFLNWIMHIREVV